VSSLDLLQRPDCHLSAGCAPGDVCALGQGRFVGWIDGLAAPVLYGAAAWLAACRLTWVMRWLKTSHDSEFAEDDVIG